MGKWGISDVGAMHATHRKVVEGARGVKQSKPYDSSRFMEMGRVSLLYGSKNVERVGGQVMDVEGAHNEVRCNLLLIIARFPAGDAEILGGEGGQASIEISIKDKIKMRD